MTAADGPDAWCYDALVNGSWPYGRDAELSVLRSLEVVWLRFDANPAYFANLVDGEQDLEDFLAGPAAVDAPAESLTAARAHVLAARRPGSSTWLALEPPPGAVLSALSWRIDDVNPAACRLPGPEAAGLYGGGATGARRGLRSLVEPGAREVAVTGFVPSGDAREPFVQLAARRTVTLARGEGRIIRCTLVPGPPAGLDLTDRARAPAV